MTELTRTKEDLRRWALSLKAEGNGLGDALMIYANAWSAEVMAQRPEERSNDTADAERWRCLKRHHLQTGTDSWIRTGDDLEEAVDALLESDRRIADGIDKLRYMNKERS